MGLDEKLRRLAQELGADFFGIADTSYAHDAILEQGGGKIAEFPRAVSMGIILPHAVVDQLPRRSELAVAVNYLAHAYDIINLRLDLMASRISSLQLNTAVRKIDSVSKTVLTNQGTFPYRCLVSTMPLPVLLKKMKGLPHKIKELSRRLEWVSVCCFNLGFNRPGIGGSRQWIYFPEKQFNFYRAGFYHNICPSLTPGNKSSNITNNTHVLFAKKDSLFFMLQPLYEFFRQLKNRFAKF